jgi:uncharacterized repeat protein (TIGR04042 family)
MPEVHFEVRWPSGLTRRYYSPSTIVHQHIKAGARYDVQDFLARTELAMNAASERVRAKFGYACSSAMDTLAQIQETAQAEQAAESPPAGQVIVIEMK